MKVEIDGKNKVLINNETYVPLRYLKEDTYLLKPHEIGEMINDLRKLYQNMEQQTLHTRKRVDHGQVRNQIENIVSKHLTRKK